MDRSDSYIDQDSSEHLSNYDEEIERIGVQLSAARDLPLLLAVRNNTFITHAQLFQLMVEKGLERDRRSFCWRIRRLIEGAHVRATAPILPYAGKVYSITRFGLAVLESYGEGLVSVTSESRNLPSVLQAPHFLELNEIRHTFHGTGKLTKWMSERELSSINYDIQASIRDEGQIDLILYLTSTMDLVFSLAKEFNRPNLPMCFASSAAFRANQMNTMLIFSYGTMRETFSLSDAIRAVLPIKD